VDRTRARQLGVPVTEVFDTMQIYLGSLYVNDFNRFGRTYSVRVQADAPYRAHAEDIGLLKVRSNSGEMVPLSALLNVKPSFGPERAIRYNGFLGADISGRNAPGFSSGQAQDAIERIAAETLPPGISYDWTEITYQEILAGNSAVWVYPLAIFLVFLVLAALYESLALPLAIILIVPMGLLAALTGVWLTHGDNNIFTQIGFMVLVGLAAKNAILIVEFARELEFAGKTPVEAAIEAARLRLRPILMTSSAFVMGVLALAFSVGAGCAASLPKIDAEKLPPTPQSFREGGSFAVAAPAVAQPRGEWWKAFSDPALDELITRADRGNTSIRVASARLTQARAFVRATD